MNWLPNCAHHVKLENTAPAGNDLLGVLGLSAEGDHTRSGTVAR